MMIHIAEKRAWAAIKSEDADEMVQAVVDVVSFLAAPRNVASKTTGMAMTQEASVHLRKAAQVRLRKVLLHLLGSQGIGGLDATDPGTRKLLVVPMMTVRILLQGVAPNCLMCNGQWIALAHLAGLDLTSPLCDVLQSDPGLKELPASALQELQNVGAKLPLHHNEVARVHNVYEPSLKVRSLSTIMRRPLEAKLLQCRMCAASIESEWFFAHPTKDRIAVLTPSNGHPACSAPGKRAYYRAIDGTPTVPDNFPNLNYCSHGSQFQMCKICTPHNFCPHNVYRYTCRVCTPHSICDHGSPRRHCKICLTRSRKRRREEWLY